MAPEERRNVKWIDGLRGMASFMVTITHLTRAWDIDLFFARTHPEDPVRILQWPVLRIAPQGRIGVTIFAFLTGYVCALKPIKLSRAGNPEAALKNISQSAFRRTPRLVIPATFATLIAWTLCQLGAYEVAHRGDSDWINVASPRRSGSLYEAVFAFFHEVIGTWTTGHNDYDDHQWTLLPLLKGSMMVYMTLYATIYMKATHRMMVSAALYVYYYLAGDATFATQFFYGLFLSDLAQHEPANEWIAARRWVRTVLPPIFMVIGLYLASYPAGGEELTTWSKVMWDWKEFITPENPGEIPRYFSALGLEFVAMAIHLSPGMKNFLASKYLLWLGKNSFAVYLIHGTLLRTLLVWFFYGPVPTPFEQEFNEEGEPIPGPQMQLFSWPFRAMMVPIWYCIVYYCAHLWTTYVDSYCAKITKRFENYVFDESEKMPVPSTTHSASAPIPAPTD